MKLIMHITNKLKLVVAIVLSITSTSCNNWLDLDSEDRILENTLFSSPKRSIYRIFKAQYVWRCFDV